MAGRIGRQSPPQRRARRVATEAVPAAALVRHASRMHESGNGPASRE